MCHVRHRLAGGDPVDLGEPCGLELDRLRVKAASVMTGILAVDLDRLGPRRVLELDPLLAVAVVVAYATRLVQTGRHRDLAALAVLVARRNREPVAEGFAVGRPKAAEVIRPSLTWGRT
jgi:hypothetical protein